MSFNSTFNPESVNYSLYYVTGRLLLPPNVDFYENLEEAIKGGVTVVQLREKDLGTKEFYELAVKTKVICDKYNVQLLINDRLDISLSIGCGLHLGQKDLPIKLARSLLGHSQILGLSINTTIELKKALADNEEYKEKNEGRNLIDYFGFGPIYETQSKANCEPSLGTKGLRALLEVLGDSKIKVVGIGGINLQTLPNVLLQSPTYILSASSPAQPYYRSLDGVAVISVLASTLTPRENAQKLSTMLKSAVVYPIRNLIDMGSEKYVLEKVANMLGSLRKAGSPVVHHITNNVVTNDTANLTLAFSCSPIMSASSEEAVELSSIISSLLINLGTLNPAQVSAMLIAGRTANKGSKMCIFDPVGVGATTFRKKTAGELLGEIKFGVIKGNAGEIGALVGSDEVKARGVDSVGNGFKDSGSVVSTLALREKLVIAMSGEIDYISDGLQTFKLSNGNNYQGVITGSGCMATSAIACFATIPGISPLLAAISGITAINIAAEKAALRSDVKGPNTFRAALIDECYNLKEEDIISMGKIQRI